MKHSLSYYITVFVLKLKGIKKDFSRDPIDYKKIRKENVPIPKGKFFRENKTQDFKVSNSLITELKKNKDSDKLLIFIHGGAFVFGPAKHHWDTIQTLVDQTEHTVWMCNYPKAPEHKISEISQNIDSIYDFALGEYQPKQITLIGDSVGGTLITALVQRLVKKKLELPRKIILVCPVMDATMSNPQIAEIDIIDPVLSKAGVLSGKKMCAGNIDLTDPMISPLYGRFEGFPSTILFLGTRDITYPDQELAVRKIKEAGVNVEVVKGEGMPHIWPLLPVMKEAKVALGEIIKFIKH